MVCPPSSVLCRSGRMDWMSSAELWRKDKKYQTFTVVSASLEPSSFTEHHGQLRNHHHHILSQKYFIVPYHTLSYFSSEILYVIVCTFWLFPSGLFFRVFPREFILTSAFSHLHFCSLLHVACTYWQVFLLKYKCMFCSILCHPLSLAKNFPLMIING